MKEIIYLILITFLPFLELRASIPYGIFKTDLHWLTIFLICVISNIILGIIIFIFLEWIIKLLRYFKPVRNIWDKHIEKTQKKISKSVDKYGEWAIAIFIGIPLPGSGVYSGAVASYILGLKFKKFLIANIIGVLIAGIIVTMISLSGASAFNFLLKMI